MHGRLQLFWTLQCAEREAKPEQAHDIHDADALKQWKNGDLSAGLHRLGLPTILIQFESQNAQIGSCFKSSHYGTQNENGETILYLLVNQRFASLVNI